uniref:Uncharacterized protein n=1 Tax=Sus scrofa TaxID=9823 RepID=A0A8D1ISM6_PIG
RRYPVVLLGSKNVGCSLNTVDRVTGNFLQRYYPYIERFYRKVIHTDSLSPSVLEIIDEHKTEQEASMQDLNIKNNRGFVLFCSLGNQYSYQSIRPSRDEILRLK